MDRDKIAAFLVIFLFVGFFIYGSSALTCMPSAVIRQDLEWSDSPSGQHRYKQKTLQAEACHEKKTKMYTTLQEGVIPIDCGRCQVFDVDLEMWDTRVDTNCWPLPPELFVGKRNCVWQNSCGLQYIKSSQVWPIRETVTCSYIKMGYSCLIPDTPVHEIIGAPEVAAMSGLVRSHDTQAVGPVDQIYPRTHKLKVTPPAIDMYPEYVLVTEIRSGLGKGDELTMTDARQQCHVRLGQGDVTTVHNFTTTALVFQMVTGDWSRASASVEICFQWFTKADVNPDFKFQKTVQMCKQIQWKSPSLPMFTLIKPRVSHHHSGMVRSHWKFPWNYPRPHPGPFRPALPSWTSLYHRLEAPDGLTHLRLQVVSLQLYSWDQLTFHSHDGPTTSNAAMKEDGLYDFETSMLTLNFTILNSRHRTQRGFLLCYQWFTSTQVPGQRPCDAFVRSVDVCRKNRRLLLPKECRSKKSKRNAKKRKREGKKKTKVKHAKKVMKDSACRKKKKTKKDLYGRKACRQRKKKKKLGKGKRNKRKKRRKMKKSA